ncbi:hypothetical protein J6590_023830 [Homalodisca vitripennis]|nr:hypothetical protein J6590_023830 [Homalodisca vitripennis]
MTDIYNPARLDLHMGLMGLAQGDRIQGAANFGKSTWLGGGGRQIVDSPEAANPQSRLCDPDHLPF